MRRVMRRAIFVIALLSGALFPAQGIAQPPPRLSLTEVIDRIFLFLSDFEDQCLPSQDELVKGKLTGEPKEWVDYITRWRFGGGARRIATAAKSGLRDAGLTAGDFMFTLLPTLFSPGGARTLSPRYRSADNPPENLSDFTKDPDKCRKLYQEQYGFLRGQLEGHISPQECLMAWAPPISEASHPKCVLLSPGIFQEAYESLAKIPPLAERLLLRVLQFLSSAKGVATVAKAGAAGVILTPDVPIQDLYRAGEQTKAQIKARVTGKPVRIEIDGRVYQADPDGSIHEILEAFNDIGLHCRSRNRGNFRCKGSMGHLTFLELDGRGFAVCRG